jgi:prepilin-type N-terminal cleavage/methylation domain-containing protein
MDTTVPAPRPRDDTGFTLLEVVVAMAIISIVLASLSAFFVRSMASVDQQGDRQAAVQLAGDAMERMRQVPGSMVTAWIQDEIAAAAANGYDPPIVNGITYDVDWDAPKVVSAAPPLIYLVVRVTWTDKACRSNRCAYASTTVISTADADPVFDPARP